MSEQDETRQRRLGELKSKRDASLFMRQTTEQAADRGAELPDELIGDLLKFIKDEDST